MMTDEEIFAKGSQAEMARDYIGNLVREAINSLSDQLLHLYPDETIKFSAIRSQMQALEDIILVVDNDIVAGKEALASIQGVAVQKEGIL